MGPSEFLCNSEEIGEGEFRERSLGQGQQRRYLIVTRRHGQLKAWLNICPHQGRALNWAPDQFLTDERGQLVCAVHGAVFEPDEGRCVSGPCLKASLRAVAIGEEDGKVWVGER